MDLIKSIGNDALFHVFMCLDDPIDLLNASLVSKSWYQYVITNGLCKSLCKKLCPEISFISNTTEQLSWTTTSDPETAMQKREHSMYSYLGHCVVSNMEKENCLLEPIGASSTANYPKESILNTLNSNDHTSGGYSYWSSKGEVDPDVPECITYRLKSNICIIDEIKIRPFKELSQHCPPVYSGKFVRFRMGYSKMAQVNIDKDLGRQQHTDDNYIWTYTSPKFTMDQRYFLQCFKLPRPVICTGGILQIEMLGRAQKKQRDGLYYICISHVKAIGHISSVFDLDMLAGTPTLKYYPDVLVRKISEIQKLQVQRKYNLQAFAMGIKQLQWNRVPHSSSCQNR